MRLQLIDTYARFLARRSRGVLLSSLVLAGVAAAVIPRLEFRSARSGISTKQDPDQARFAEFEEELGGGSVVVLAEGGSEEERRNFTEKLASELVLQKGLIAGVFYRLPMDFFRKRALGLAPAEELEKIAEALEKEKPQLVALAEARGLHDVHRILAERMERDIRQGRRPKGEEETEGLLTLQKLLMAEKCLIERPIETAAELERLDVFQLAAILSPKDTSLRKFAQGGYLTSTDGSLYMCLVQPRSTSESLDELKALLTEIRRAADTARAGTGVRYGLTGEAVVTVEESETVKRDGIRCALYGCLGIGLLAALAFRRRLAILLVLLTLAMAIVWNTGLTWVIFGGFNLITSAVPVILLGLGTDFGIHVVIAYEVGRAQGRSPREAVVAALVRIGPGLLTGAVTTALAFYAICFMKYRGFQEFGVIAGNGVLLCALAMASVLPACLLITDRRTAGPPPTSSKLARFWGILCRVATASPVFTCAASLLVTIWSFYMARGIGFDYRVENLLPKNAESLRTQDRMQGDPALTPEFAVVFCNDRESLKAADARAAGLKETIGRLESILYLIPEGPPVRAALMQKLQALLSSLKFEASRLETLDAQALKASIESLQAVFDRALDLVAGHDQFKETARLLDSISVSLEEAAGAVAKAGPRFASEFAAASARLWMWAGDRKAEVDRQLAAGPVREEEVPPEILDKLKGKKSGRYALYLYPKEALSSDRGALERFVRAAREVDPAATGYPIVFFATTSLIHQGFSTAVAAAALVIFLTLFLDFRQPSRVLLATLPKLLGIVWMLGIMRLLGLNYNLANQIVIPLLIGVGLSYGIHIIHGFFSQAKETRSLTRVLEHTGGAIVLSGLTTMVGFGSLGLASHRGLSSMGTVLFFGVGAALVASTWVLANILYLIYRPKD